MASGQTVTLPDGTTTYIGRRSRLPDGYGTPPPPPGAVSQAPVTQRTLQWSPVALPAPLPLRILSTAGSRVISQLPGFVVGWSVLETSGNARAALQLFDGQGTTAALIASIGLAEGEASQLSIGPPGWTVYSGLYLSAATGAFDGTIWFLPAEGAETPAAAPPASGG